METTSALSRDNSPTLLVLRVAMGLTWAGIGGAALLSARQAPPVALAFYGCCLLGFLAALLLNLRHAVPGRDRGGPLALLAVQVVLGLVVATDLMLLVALELPLVLRPRRAVVAFAALVVLIAGLGALLARVGQFVPAAEAAGLPEPWPVVMTLALTVGWQLLAFAGGLLAATEIRARRDVQRLLAGMRLVEGRLEVAGRESERLRIARDLHDTLGHRLAALGVHFDLESRRADPAASAPLREARDAVQHLLGEMRDVVGALRAEHPVDLKRSLAALVADLDGLDVELTVSPGFELTDAPRAQALLRCGQEALTNVLRHAGASRVWIDLGRSAGGVSLRVRDDGPGGVPEREGHGLRGMRERLAEFGGTLELAAAPGGGLDLLARLPVEDLP